MAEDCRAAAARVIAQVIRGGAALDEPLARHLNRVRPRDRALLQQLCYGTLREYFRLEWILGQALERPLKARDADIRALLLCGLHQLLDLRVPDHAAIGETVQAARALGKPWATGLVNGVLRSCRRNADSVERGLPEEARWNHPGWLLNDLREAWPERWLSIIDANNSHPPMCLRINRQKVTRDDYLARLREAGIEAVGCLLSRDGIRLAKPQDVAALPGFTDGLVSVQDEAAQLAAPLLDPAPGERILDACSAPGGKACHLLETQPGAELTAMDIDHRRLAKVEENLHRLGLTAELLVGDGSSPPAALREQSFDRILADVPCSGSGVIRRHPDIRLLRRRDDVENFSQRQLAILQGLWPLLAPGGCLLYVTCSILPVENRRVVESFLSECADAEPLPVAAAWGLPAGVGRQLLPEINGPDGLFFAVLKRRTGATAK